MAAYVLGISGGYVESEAGGGRLFRFGGFEQAISGCFFFLAMESQTPLSPDSTHLVYIMCGPHFFVIFIGRSTVADDSYRTGPTRRAHGLLGATHGFVPSACWLLIITIRLD